MPDVTLTLNTAAPVELDFPTANVALSLTTATPVNLNLSNTPVNLSLTTATPVNLSLSPGVPGPGVPIGGTAWQFLVKDSGTDFDTSWQVFTAYLATIPEYDSNDAATSAGATFYRASASHDAAAKGTLIYLG